MKLLLLVCVSVAASTPLRARSLSPSVFDYYDFVEIPRTQTAAAPRADGPLPRRPIHLRAAPPRMRPQAPRGRLPDYQLANADGIPPKFRNQPKFRPQFRPQYKPEMPVVYGDEPVYEEPVFKPQFQQEPVIYVEEVVTGRPLQVRERPQRHQDDQIHRYQGERPPVSRDYLPSKPLPPKYHQEERRPQYEDQPQYEKLPVYEEGFRPFEQPQHEEHPKFEQGRPQYEEQPRYEERPQYEEQDLPEDLREYEEEKLAEQHQVVTPEYVEPLKKDLRKPVVTNHVPRTKVKVQDDDLSIEKRQVLPGGHLDPAGEQFVADASVVESGKGEGRLSFQIHGQQGPHSYRFGYDTGKGHNRQFRYEERDGNGQVHGRYGFYDKDGKLQVVNYSAHPDHGFTADVPH